MDADSIGVTVGSVVSSLQQQRLGATLIAKTLEKLNSTPDGGSAASAEIQRAALAEKGIGCKLDITV